MRFVCILNHVRKIASIAPVNKTARIKRAQHAAPCSASSLSVSFSPAFSAIFVVVLVLVLPFKGIARSVAPITITKSA